jgi:hypothetical protein
LIPFILYRFLRFWGLNPRKIGKTRRWGFETRSGFCKFCVEKDQEDQERSSKDQGGFRKIASILW